LTHGVVDDAVAFGLAFGDVGTQAQRPPRVARKVGEQSGGGVRVRRGFLHQPPQRCW
jgi:hypothetical protein